MRISDWSSDVCSSDLFKERGLPDAIRSDNGVPFASPNGLYNLSQLSVWWLRLGIEIERIKPGQPQQNGRHERMHLTLKKETTRPPRANILQQQARFRSEEHTSELQSLMRISYAVFCLTKKTQQKTHINTYHKHTLT